MDYCHYPLSLSLSIHTLQLGNSITNSVIKSLHLLKTPHHLPSSKIEKKGGGLTAPSEDMVQRSECSGSAERQLVVIMLLVARMKPITTQAITTNPVTTN